MVRTTSNLSWRERRSVEREGGRGVVLHKRRAKYGGDWLMGGVKLRKISAIQIRKLHLVTPVTIKIISL